MVDFPDKVWKDAPAGYREGDAIPSDATPLDADGLNDLEARINASVAALNTAITNVVNGAPGALDTLKELADALGDDANFATTVTNTLASKAPLAAVLAGVASTVTLVGAGAITANAINVLDATAGTFIAALPAAAAGAVVVVEKDAGANIATVSGTFRGTVGTIDLKLPRESMLFVSLGGGNYWPIAGHKTLSSLDARYALASASGNLVLGAAISLTGSATLTPGRYHEIDSTLMSPTLTLPSGITAPLMTVVRWAAGPKSNPVFISAASLDGVSGALVRLGFTSEAIVFLQDSAGGWHTVASHKTKGSLDDSYMSASEGVGLAADVAAAADASVLTDLPLRAGEVWESAFFDQGGGGAKLFGGVIRGSAAAGATLSLRGSDDTALTNDAQVSASATAQNAVLAPAMTEKAQARFRVVNGATDQTISLTRKAV